MPSKIDRGTRRLPGRCRNSRPQLRVKIAGGDQFALKLLDERFDKRQLTFQDGDPGGGCEVALSLLLDGRWGAHESPPNRPASLSAGADSGGPLGPSGVRLGVKPPTSSSPPDRRADLSVRIPYR